MHNLKKYKVQVIVVITVFIALVSLIVGTVVIGQVQKKNNLAKLERK